VHEAHEIGYKIAYGCTRAVLPCANPQVRLTSFLFDV
jgi:hypothetical protein